MASKFGGASGFSDSVFARAVNGLVVRLLDVPLLGGFVRRGLVQVGDLHQPADVALTADDAGRHGLLETERAAYREDPLTHLDPVGITEARRYQVLGDSLQADDGIADAAPRTSDRSLHSRDGYVATAQRAGRSAAV